MQHALPYKAYQPQNNNNNNNDLSVNRSSSSINHQLIYVEGQKGNLKRVVNENSVIVFAKRGCCMTHVVKCLLHGQGVNPAVYEVDEKDEDDVVNELEKIDSGNGEEGRLQLPAVFIGGKLFGGLDRIMATHISGELRPVLQQAGALWL